MCSAPLLTQLRSDITMYECLVRSHEPAPHVAPDISTAIERIQAVEAKKGRRREGQIADAKKKRDERDRKRAREDEATGTDGDGPSGEPLPKRVQLNDAADADEPVAGAGAEADDVEMAAGSESGGAATPAKGNSNGKSKGPKAAHVPPPRQMPASRLYTSKPANTHLRGHTSFLTFATLLPSSSGSLDGSPSAEQSGVADVGAEAAVAVAGEASAVADETDEFPLSPGAREALLAVDESVFIEG